MVDVLLCSAYMIKWLHISKTETINLIRHLKARMNIPSHEQTLELEAFRKLHKVRSGDSMMYHYPQN